MITQIEPSWKKILIHEFSKAYFLELTRTIRAAYHTNTPIYPAPSLIFNAFSLCPFDAVKVVIIGQDPYHGAGQAHGLSFSVQDGMRIPPSLRNIFKELQTDLKLPPHTHGDLTHWATQGVLLLNSTLTVREGAPNSHKNIGWETFTDAVIKKISDDKEHVVFLLWGNYAQKKSIQIDTSKHLVLASAHPSPFSAHNGFFGCGHFRKTNMYLQKYGITPINW